jgi:CRISPR/Cas system endoribonuclease Cas6 (RAMP superfamily)
MLQFPKHKQVGFVGRCTYLVRGADPLAPLLETLAAFAFYSGVGMHTTHGMGQVRWVPNHQE